MPCHGEPVEGHDFGSNVLALPRTAQLAALMTTIRDKDTRALVAVIAPSQTGTVCSRC